MTGRNRSAELSGHFLRVALLAVDFLAPVRRIRREELGGFAIGGRVVFRAVRAVARPFEELSRVTERHAVQMPLIGMAMRNREMMFAVELEFLFDDSEGLPCDLALDGPIQNVVGDLRNVGWKFGSGNGLFDLGERGLIVGPGETLFEGFFPN